ncbi:MAG TPA: TMEM175 family protein [Aggregatilineales bacterium]|nr:TMEM175 family protein [Aggregatilineales bacterium]
MNPPPHSAPHHEHDEKETGRVEAFSDGVLAIAITLLALELKVPPPSGDPGFSLARELLDQWPTYFAFLVSFFFILVIWINHHRLFTVIRRIDNNLLIFNGLLLMSITLIPFVTDLVATYLQRPEQNIAAMVYAGLFLVNSFCFNLL